MLSRDQIVTRMQFDILADKSPLGTTEGPAVTLTYAFANGTPPAELPTSDTFTGWRALEPLERAAVLSALRAFETVINVEFVEVSAATDADLDIGAARLDGAAGLGGPGIVFVGDEILDYDGFALFDERISLQGEQNLILHEIGHALGLRHPFDAPAIPAAFENNKYTVMSYTPNPETGAFPPSLQIFDVLALQAFWGAAPNAGGDDVYTGAGGLHTRVIHDTGGTDWLSAEGSARATGLDTNEAGWSHFGTHYDVVVAYDTVIENARGGTRGDLMAGNAHDNVLEGGAGDDDITGGAGDDRLIGGADHDDLRGGAGDDVLEGGDGSDLLEGGAGADTLTGGAGTDVFRFRPGAGTDTVVDFETGIDALDLVAFGFGTLDAAIAVAEEIEAGVRFALGAADLLLVEGQTLAGVGDDIYV